MSYAQHLAQQQVLDVDGAPGIHVHADGENYQAQGKHAGEDHSNGSVVADARLAAEETHQHGNGNAAGDGGNVRREAHQGRHGDGSNDRMGQGVGHEGSAPGDDVGADHGQQEPHQG